MARKKTVKEKIDKFEFERAFVISINAEKIETEVDAASLMVKWDYDHEVDSERLIIKSKCKVYFEPETACKIETQYSLVYSIKDDCALEDIDGNIEELIAPCGNLNSLIVGQLFERFVDSPILIPPTISVNKKEYGTIKRK